MARTNDSRACEQSFGLKGSHTDALRSSKSKPVLFHPTSPSSSSTSSSSFSPSLCSFTFSPLLLSMPPLLEAAVAATAASASAASAVIISACKEAAAASASLVASSSSASSIFAQSRAPPHITNDAWALALLAVKSPNTTKLNRSRELLSP